MWNRKELKERARIAFNANYWKMVAVSLLMLLVGRGGNVLTFKTDKIKTDEIMIWLDSLSQNELLAVVLGGLGFVAAFGTVLFLAKIFLLNPLYVGCKKFVKENAEFPADFNEVGSAFKSHYGNAVLTMFLKNLFLALWTMLFIVPGIIKFYSYRMVPFILADNPEMSSTDIITKSRDMMRGQKFDAFVLDLSFLGWSILSVITCGILGVFYVFPYMAETNAELYLVLKENQK